MNRGKMESTDTERTTGTRELRRRRGALGRIAVTAMATLAVFGGCGWFGFGGTVTNGDITVTIAEQTVGDGGTIDLGTFDRTAAIEQDTGFDITITNGGSAGINGTWEIEGVLPHPDDQTQDAGVSRLFVSGGGGFGVSPRSSTSYLGSVSIPQRSTLVKSGTRTAALEIAVTETESSDSTPFTVAVTLTATITGDDGVVALFLNEADASAGYTAKLYGSDGKMMASGMNFGEYLPGSDNRLLMSEDPLPNGDYTLIVADEQFGGSFTSETRGAYETVTVDGDTAVTLAATEFVPTVEQTAGASAFASPDGADLHVEWAVNGTPESLLDGMGRVLGTFAAGNATTESVYLLPGTYAMAVHVDENDNRTYNDVPNFLGLDAGELVGTITGVVVAGGDTPVPGSSLEALESTVALSPDADTPALGQTATWSYEIDYDDGYLDIPTDNDVGKAYGVYVTDPSGTIDDLTIGYYNGSFVTIAGDIAVGDVFSAGFEATGSADYIAKVSLPAGEEPPQEFLVSIELREAPLGSSEQGSAVNLELDTPTLVAAKYLDRYFKFTADASTQTIEFTNLTYGVDVKVTDGGVNTFVDTSDGTETQVTKTVEVTGLTPSSEYYIEITDLAGPTNHASVGLLEIK